jgi:hypothetical protein
MIARSYLALGSPAGLLYVVVAERLSLALLYHAKRAAKLRAWTAVVLRSSRRKHQ